MTQFAAGHETISDEPSSYSPEDFSKALADWLEENLSQINFGENEEIHRLEANREKMRNSDFDDETKDRMIDDLNRRIAALQSDNVNRPHAYAQAIVQGIKRLEGSPYEPERIVTLSWVRQELGKILEGDILPASIGTQEAGSPGRGGKGKKRIAIKEEEKEAFLNALPETNKDGSVPKNAEGATKMDVVEGIADTVHMATRGHADADSRFNTIKQQLVKEDKIKIVGERRNATYFRVSSGKTGSKK